MDAGSADRQQRFWVVLAPATTPSPYALPTLPPELAPWAPSSLADFTQIPRPAVLAGSFDSLTTYKDVRNQVGPGVLGDDSALPGRAYILRLRGVFLFND